MATVRDSFAPPAPGVPQSLVHNDAFEFEVVDTNFRSVAKRLVVRFLRRGVTEWHVFWMIGVKWSECTAGFSISKLTRGEGVPPSSARGWLRQNVQTKVSALELLQNGMTDGSSWTSGLAEVLQDLDRFLVYFNKTIGCMDGPAVEAKLDSLLQELSQSLPKLRYLGF